MSRNQSETVVLLVGDGNERCCCCCCTVDEATPTAAAAADREQSSNPDHQSTSIENRPSPSNQLIVTCMIGNRRDILQ